MLGFNVLPKTRLILGFPKTVFALPDISQLLHFLRNFSLEIYAFKRDYISAPLVKFTFMLVPGIL